MIMQKNNCSEYGNETRKKRVESISCLSHEDLEKLLVDDFGFEFDSIQTTHPGIENNTDDDYEENEDNEPMQIEDETSSNQVDCINDITLLSIKIRTLEEDLKLKALVIKEKDSYITSLKDEINKLAAENKGIKERTEPNETTNEDKSEQLIAVDNTLAAANPSSESSKSPSSARNMPYLQKIW